MSQQFTVKRKEWGAKPADPDAEYDKRKDGQIYIGPRGELRRHYKGAEDKLVIAPKGFPTTQKNRIADTREKRNELNRLRLLVRMRDLRQTILDKQIDHTDDDIKDMDAPPWAEEQKQLREAYDTFRKTFGPLNHFEYNETGRLRHTGESVTYKVYPNLKKFRKDPDAYKVAALEEYDPITGKITLDPIFERRVVRPRQKTAKAKSLKEALNICLDQKAAIDLPFIAEIYGAQDESEILQKLKKQNLVYFDPAQGAWVDAARYFSGCIADKIHAVEQVIDTQPELKRNLEALREVRPDDPDFSDIYISLGMPWITPQLIEDFAYEVLDIGEVEVSYFPKKHAWYVTLLEDRMLAQSSEYATEFVDAHRLLKAALNKGAVSVTRTKDHYDQSIDPDFETSLARDKQKEIEEAFRKWIGEDKERIAAIKKAYERFASVVPREKFDASSLSLPGSSLSVDLRPHQSKAVWRNIQTGNTLYEHATGSGKTYTAIATSMKLVALGKAEKPLLNVPNQMVGEFAAAFHKFYPQADILVIEPDEMLEDGAKLNIHEKMQKVMDRIKAHKGPVIMSHANFDRFEVSAEFRLQRLLGEARDYKRAYDDLGHNSIKKMYDNALEEIGDFLYTSGASLKAPSEIAALADEHLNEDADAKIWQDYLAKIESGDVLDFAESGFDYIITDEGHGYKNTDIDSRFPEMASEGSAKTLKYEEKLDYLYRKKGSYYHTLMSWTPVSNAIPEVYTMKRFLDPDLMKDMGIECFDAWAHCFFRAKDTIEIAPEGGYRTVERLSDGVNIPEMKRMYQSVSDIVPDDMLDLEKPELEGGKEKTVIVPQYPALTKYLEDLSKRAQAARAGVAEKGGDNLLKIMNEGIMATLHPDMVEGIDYDPEDTVTKIDIMADEIAARYQKYKNNVYHNERGEADSLSGALQMVLCDLGIAKSDYEFSVYDYLKEKLVERGVPASKVQFIHDHTSAAKKRDIERKCNNGEVSVIIGTTAKLGTGKNVQKRLIALHQPLMLWRPSDDDQGKGRIDRQGNQNKVVEILRYVVENSPDGFRWQKLAYKSGFIDLLKTRDLETREVSASAQTMGYNEVVAAILNDPLMYENLEISQELARLTRMKEAQKQQTKRAKKALPKLRAQIKEEQGATLHLKPVFKAMATHGAERSGLVIDGEKPETAAEAGALLKERIRAVRDDLREKRKISIKDFGTLYGYKISLEGASEVETRTDDENKEQKFYKYRFVFKIEAPESFEISISSSDIRQIEAERLLTRKDEAAGDADKEKALPEFDAAKAGREMNAFDAALFYKLRAPFAKIKSEFEQVELAVEKLNAEKQRLTEISRQSFDLSEDIDRLKKQQKQIGKKLKKRAKDSATGGTQPVPEII